MNGKSVIIDQVVRHNMVFYLVDYVKHSTGCVCVFRNYVVTHRNVT